jgi:ABC-type transporter MlaC component
VPIQYTGERVEGDFAVVSTKILATQDKEIPVVYRMLRHGDRWLIYDVAPRA